MIDLLVLPELGDFGLAPCCLEPWEKGGRLLPEPKKSRVILLRTEGGKNLNIPHLATLGFLSYLKILLPGASF